MKQTIPIKEVLEILNKQLDILKLMSMPMVVIKDEEIKPPERKHNFPWGDPSARSERP